jgi:large conductance mechanosensitive channel
MFKGFRDFILRGNVMDLAVAVVIGAAFTAIVNALVTDIVNPLIAAVVHKPDFSALILDINGGKVKYGDFLNAIISFLLIAAVVYFVFVLPVNALMKKFHPAQATPPTTHPCPECLSSIPIEAKRCSQCGQPVTPALAS